MSINSYGGSGGSGGGGGDSSNQYDNILTTSRIQEVSRPSQYRGLEAMIDSGSNVVTSASSQAALSLQEFERIQRETMATQEAQHIYSDYQFIPSGMATISNEPNYNSILRPMGMPDNMDNAPKNKKSKLTEKFIKKIQKDKVREIEENLKKELKKKEDSIIAKKSQKENIDVEISKIEDDLKNLEKQEVKNLITQFEEIKKIENIEDIYLLDEDIVFKTKELFVADFYMDCNAIGKKKTKNPHDLGEFAIRINKDFNKMSVTNLTYDGGGYDLPTVKFHECCWGNIYNDIQKDLSELDLVEFVNDMIAYITSPNNESAYKRWGAWLSERKKCKKQNKIAPVTQNVNNMRGIESYITRPEAFDEWSSWAIGTDVAVSTATGTAMLRPYNPITMVQRLLDRHSAWEWLLRPGGVRSSREGLDNFLDCFRDEICKEYVAGWMLLTERQIEGSNIERLVLQTHNDYFIRIIFGGSRLDIQVPNPRDINTTRLNTIINQVNDELRQRRDPIRQYAATGMTL